MTIVRRLIKSFNMDNHRAISLIHKLKIEVPGFIADFLVATIDNSLKGDKKCQAHQDSKSPFLHISKIKGLFCFNVLRRMQLLDASFSENVARRSRIRK